MNKINDLISKHWEWAKNRIDKNGIKYSDKYSEEEHKRFIKKWIESMGFDDIEARLSHAMKYNELLHII